jgi:hypothetical protein
LRKLEDHFKFSTLDGVELLQFLQILLTYLHLIG